MTIHSSFAMSRRSLLAGCGAALAASTIPARAHPSPGFILKGGLVVTMEPGALARHADIFVRDGQIIEIGDQLPTSGAEQIDLTGTVIIPGLVDTHWHMWNSLARGFSMSRLGPFAKTMAPLSKAWTPDAAALSVKIAVAEALHSGITTVNNWAHNTKSIEFAEAEYAAMQEVGIRGRFSYGYPQSLKPEDRMDFDSLDAFLKAHPRTNGVLHVGICTRGPDRSAGSVWREEWEFARDRHMPVTTHIASDRAAASMNNIAVMAREGLLGPDIQLVHATHANEADFKMISEARSPISLSPWTELEVGYGIPPIALMADKELTVGLSVDNMVLSGNADMFSVMKITADIAAGQSETQGKVPNEKVLDWATFSGAKGLGLDFEVGTLTPGKRADIVAIRMDDLNTVGSIGPQFALTHAAQPANVDFVMTDGRVRKRDGRLVDIDQPALVEASARVMSDLRQKIGL